MKKDTEDLRPLHPQGAHQSGGLHGPAFTPYQPPLGCNWWDMDKHTAVGDVLPYLTKAALFKPAIVAAEALQKYATNKGTQLWFSSHGGS